MTQSQPDLEAEEHVKAIRKTLGLDRLDREKMVNLLERALTV